MENEWVFIPSQGAYYPKRCSFCRNFRQVWDGKKTKHNGVPMPNANRSTCSAKTPRFGGYKSEYILEEHGVLPYQQLANGCRDFAWIF